MKKMITLITIVALTLTNYQLAKLCQRVLMQVSIPYEWALVIPWALICAIPCLLALHDSGLKLSLDSWKKNWKELLAWFALVMVGLLVFVKIGVTGYFNDVKYPLIFFLVTPLVEELLFRGWIYGQLEKLKLWPVLLSAALFGIHHLQYFGYRPTAFALFQITYTFGLGIMFGKMRERSGSIYLSLVAHCIINFVAVYF